LLSFGPRAHECLKAADQLGAFGLSTTVADARFAKPLDEDLIRRLARNHEVLVTVEEGSIGGFGSHVLRFLAESGLLDRGLKVRTMVLPDEFIEHGKPEAMYEHAGLTAPGIVTLGPPPVPPRWEWLPSRVNTETELHWFDFVLSRGAPGELPGFRKLDQENGWSVWGKVGAR
jgi:hypothetical protein